MKRTIYSLIVILELCMIWSSCSKEAMIEKRIIGTWKVIELTSKQDGQTQKENIDKYGYTFNNDGTAF